MIKECMDRNVATYGTMERWKDTVTPQVKTKAGRTVVWEKSTTVHSDSQITRELGGSLRPQFHRLSAVQRTSIPSMEMVSSEKPKIFETETDQYTIHIDNTIQELQEEYKRAPDKLLFCLKVGDRISTLKNMLIENPNLKKADRKKYNRYIILKATPLYNDAIGVTLEFLQNRVDEGNGWIYFDDLKKVTRLLNEFNSNNNNESHKEILSEIWKQYLHREMSYMRYLTDLQGAKYSADLTMKNIRWLLSKSSPIHRLKLISIEDTKEQAESLNNIIISNINNSGTRRETEKLDESRDDLHHEEKVTDIMARRRAHDKLFEILDTTSREKTKNRFAITGWHTSFLELLIELHDEHNRLFGNQRTPLRQKLKTLIPYVVNSVQTDIEKYTDGDDQLKTKTLALIEHLRKEGYSLDEECQNLYPGYTQSHGVVGTHPTQVVSGITYDQYDSWISATYSIFDFQADYIKAACELRELLKYKKRLNYRSNVLRNRLNTLEQLLYRALFAPIFDAYDNAISAKKSHKEIAIEMHKYKDKFIELNKNDCGYMLNTGKIPTWKNMACLAWSNDIEKLCEKSSFSEDDVNDLLLLKDTVPDPLQNEHIKNHFQIALKNMLQFMSENNPSVELTKSVMQLSKWVDDLDKQHEIDSMLRRANKKWQERQKRQVIVASSGTSVGAYPSTADVSLKVSDRYPYVEQPLSSSFSGIPTPATRQSQSVGSYYTPETQLPTEIKLQPAPLSMPIPATHQLFQQPKPVTYYRSPMDQPPAETKSWLVPPGMLTPATHQLFQQPKPVNYYQSPMDQPPAEIKSWPVPLGMLTPATHQLFQQPKSVNYYRSSMDQPPAEIKLRSLSAHYQVPSDDEQIPPEWQAVAQQLCELQSTTSSSESRERYSLNSDSP